MWDVGPSLDTSTCPGAFALVAQRRLAQCPAALKVLSSLSPEGSSGHGLEPWSRQRESATRPWGAATRDAHRAARRRRCEGPTGTQEDMRARGSCSLGPTWRRCCQSRLSLCNVPSASEDVSELRPCCVGAQGRLTLLRAAPCPAWGGVRVRDGGEARELPDQPPSTRQRGAATTRRSPPGLDTRPEPPGDGVLTFRGLGEPQPTEWPQRGGARGRRVGAPPGRPLSQLPGAAVPGPETRGAGARGRGTGGTSVQGRRLASG